MLLSYVLRLVPEALAEGRFAGTLHVVETGRTVPFSSVDELLVALTPRPRAPSDARPGARTIHLDAGRRRAAARDLDP
jgi:hypothetical protein